MFVLAVAFITHFSFGMTLNQMLQVPHRKKWTLGQRKCELFKISFFRLRKYPSGVCISCAVLSLYVFVCVTDIFTSAD